MNVLRRISFLACAALGATGLSRAQAVANPNQIQGTFELTNVNPDVLAYLEAPGDLGLASVRASATPPLAYPSYRASTTGVVDSRLRGRFELTVETSATGIPYVVTPEVGLAQGGFRLATVTTELLFPEPAPDAAVAFAGCAGILRVHFRDASGAPCVVADARVIARNTSGMGAGADVAPGGSDVVLALRGGDGPYTLTITWTTGSDPMHDRITHAVTLPDPVLVACDAIVDLDVGCDAAGEVGGLGRIIGNVDVLGVDEIVGGWSYVNCRTQVVATGGPMGNVRYDCLTSTPSSGPYELENLVPGESTPFSGWKVLANVDFMRGASFGTLSWPDQRVTVRPGETTDLGDRFVMNPGFVREEVVIVGAPTRPPGFTSMLKDVADGGGPVSLHALGMPDVAPGATVSASGIDASSVGGTGSYDPVLERVTGTNEVVTGGYFGEPSVHEVSLRNFSSYNGVRDEDPDNCHAASFGAIEPEMARVLVTPGTTTTFRHEYCTGELRISVHSTGAAFCAPYVSARGSLAGRDFRGRPVSRQQHGGGLGTPVAVGNAAIDGQILLVLVEGQYDVYPSATFLNPGGGTSSTQFREFTLGVGCRQVIDASPEVQVEVAAPPACAADRVVIEGSAHAVAGLASITWEVAGGSPSVLCADCGTDRDFTISVPLPDADAEIIVRATDSAGIEAVARSFTQFTREPSAGDLRPGAVPLTIARDGATLHLGWEATGARVDVARGTIASLHLARAYDHRADGACDLEATAIDVPLPAEDSYFLVSGRCSRGGATTGRDSFGREIPPAFPACP